MTLRTGVSYGVLVLIAMAFRFICDRRVSHASYRASVDVKRILRDKIYSKLLRLGAAYREKTATSEVVQMAAEGVEQLETYFGKYLSQLFYSLLAPVTLFVLLSFINWKASLVLLICVPLIPVSIVAVQKIAKRLLNKYWGIYTELGDSFLENLQGLTTLKIYRSDEKKAEEMDEESQRFRRITMKVLTMQLNSTSVMDIIAYGGAAVGMIVTLSEFMKGYLSVHGALMLILLAAEFFIPLRGLDETIQYRQGEKRREEMKKLSRQLGEMQRGLNRLEASQKSVTNLVILLFSFAMLFLMIGLKQAGSVDLTGMLVGTIAMMGSFGPVTAFASLSNNLNQTLASGERVLSILEEEPQVEEVTGAGSVFFADAEADNVDFAYEEEQILKDYSIKIPKGKVVGIHGASGSGKSTLLKLLMRFWDVQGGQILISGRDVRGINTSDLREMESCVTQETCLFHDSIANNIAVGKPEASRDEIMEAAKKASIHDFIMTLPNGYDTEVGELGDTLSGGEKQRIGIARAFLHDAPFLLLDEPTSNLDSLNEGIILKSLKEGKGDKTVLLVSHRKSTMNLADVVYEMDNGRVS